MNKQGKTINRKEPIESKVSTAIMNLLWQGKLRVAPSASELTRDGGVAQRTYLLNREDQRKEFLNAGYIEGREGDYGLVKKQQAIEIFLYIKENQMLQKERTQYLLETLIIDIFLIKVNQFTLVIFLRLFIIIIKIVNSIRKLGI